MVLERNGALDFVSGGIVGLTSIIRPHYPVTCVFTDLRSLSRRHPRYPFVTRYQPRAIVQTEVRGPFRSIPQTMLIDRVKTSQLALVSTVLGQTVWLSNLVFEGVRRFIVAHVLAQNDFLPPNLLEEICEKNEEVVVLRESLIQNFYVDGGVTAEELGIEIDVQMVALITQVAMRDALIRHGQAGYDELLPFLTLTRSTLTPAMRERVLSLF
jgi:hypothetical protein